MPSIQAARHIVPTTLLASVLLCACASVSPNHAATLRAPTAGVGAATDAPMVRATAPSVSTKASNADSKVTCHTEALTGSRVAARVCETAAQRKARQAAARDTQDQLGRPVPSCARLGPSGCAGGN